MNAEQQRFLDFILSKAKEDKKEEIQELLQSNFEKQDQKTFKREDAEYTGKMLLECVKPEYLGEIKLIVEKFSSLQPE